MGVILRQLFRDFPVQLTIVIICLTISAIVGVVPAVYIERLTGYIEPVSYTHLRAHET